MGVAVLLARGKMDGYMRKPLGVLLAFLQQNFYNNTVEKSNFVVFSQKPLVSTPLTPLRQHQMNLGECAMKRISACLCFLLLAFAMVVPTVAGPSTYFDDMLVALPTEYASYYRMQTADMRTLPPDWADRTVLVPRRGASSGYALYQAAGVQAITVGVYHTLGSALLEDSSAPGGFRFGFASSPEALRGRAYPLLWDSGAQTVYARLEKGLFSLSTSSAYPMPKAAEKAPSLMQYGLNLSASRDGNTFSSSLQYAPVSSAFSNVSGGAYEQFRAVVPQGTQAIKVELCGADSSVFLASVLLEGTNLFDVQKPSPSSSLPDTSSSQPSSGAGSQSSSRASSSSKPSSKAASSGAEGEKSTSKFEGTIVYGEKSTSSKSASSKGASGTKKATTKTPEPFSGEDDDEVIAAAQAVQGQEMEQDSSSSPFRVLRAGTQRKVSSGVWVTVYTVAILSAGVFVILKQF